MAEPASAARPCSWVAEGDEHGNQIGRAWCTVHQHDEDGPRCLPAWLPLREGRAVTALTLALVGIGVVLLPPHRALHVAAGVLFLGALVTVLVNQAGV